MTREEIMKRVTDLEKMQDDLNNKVEENAKMVIDILDKFYYKSGDFQHKMYIIKSNYSDNYYSFAWYFEPENKEFKESDTHKAVKYATETGAFDTLLEHILDVAIPHFIQYGSNIPGFKFTPSTKSESKEDLKEEVIGVVYIK